MWIAVVTIVFGGRSGSSGEADHSKATQPERIATRKIPTSS